MSCAAAACVVGGCASGTTPTGPTMDVTVSTMTDAPVTIYFDARQRGRSGVAGRGVPPTPVELSPERPSAVVTVPYDPGSWLRVRVAGPADRPTGHIVGCELRATDGRLLAVDATDPFDPPDEDASCAGSE
ncbi:hypothetical protein [Actinomycetospora sp. TBRC 11914]|uniref:hypothetical protein n=1 Tax=Actinomycetospora sp. TBRC 11914 TaxID=2729387 RepID=UPI00145FB475|nr:hypothetical protein [Actinomycetospora sp. TBRC 11914]NMO88305.1 hypothetical protein [Actinomycetospora sp. TBRC 11914]